METNVSTQGNIVLFAEESHSTHAHNLFSHVSLSILNLLYKVKNLPPLNIQDKKIDINNIIKRNSG